MVVLLGWRKKKKYIVTPLVPLPLHAGSYLPDEQNIGKCFPQISYPTTERIGKERLLGRTWNYIIEIEKSNIN